MYFSRTAARRAAPTNRLLASRLATTLKRRRQQQTKQYKSRVQEKTFFHRRFSVQNKHASVADEAQQLPSEPLRSEEKLKSNKNFCRRVFGRLCVRQTPLTVGLSS